MIHLQRSYTRVVAETPFRARLHPVEVGAMSCITCNKERADTLFFGCLHLRACHECAQAMTHCPVCHCTIASKLQVRVAESLLADSPVSDHATSQQRMPFVGLAADDAQPARSAPAVLALCDGELHTEPPPHLAKARAICDWVARNVRGYDVVGAESVWPLFDMDGFKLYNDFMYWEVFNSQWRKVWLQVHPDKHQFASAADAATYLAASQALSLLRTHGHDVLGRRLLPQPSDVAVEFGLTTDGARVAVVRWSPPSSMSQLLQTDVVGGGGAFGSVSADDDPAFVVTEAQWPEFFQLDACYFALRFSMAAGPLAGANGGSVAETVAWPKTPRRINSADLNVEGVQVVCHPSTDDSGPSVAVRWIPPYPPRPSSSVGWDVRTSVDVTLERPCDFVQLPVLPAGSGSILLDQTALGASPLRIVEVYVYHQVKHVDASVTSGVCKSVEVDWSSTAQAPSSFGQRRRSDSPGELLTGRGVRQDARRGSARAVRTAQGRPRSPEVRSTKKRR